MPTNVRRLVTLAVLLEAAMACSVFGGATPAPVLEIGVDLPLSGAEAAVGTPALDAVRLFVAQHPILHGYAVTLVVKDDSRGGTAEPPLGATNVEALVADPRVMGVIGPLDSSVARAEIPVANQASLALVSPGTSSPCLTRAVYLPAALNPSLVPITCKDAGLAAAAELRPSGVNDYFRLAATDDLQGPAAAEFAYRTLHLLRVATIADGEGYGQALAAAFASRFRTLGGSIVGTLDAGPAAKAGVPGFLKAAKADGAQAVYFGGTSSGRGCAVRADMASVFGPGRAAPMLGGDGIAEDPTCLQDAAANSEGIYATVPLPDVTDLGTAQPVIRAYKAAYPKPRGLGAYTVIAYDAVAVLYDAIDRAIGQQPGGALPPRGNVVSQLSATDGFPGATGVFGFDANGDTTRPRISIYESPAAGGSAWTPAGQVDYTVSPPY